MRGVWLMALVMPSRSGFGKHCGFGKLICGERVNETLTTGARSVAGLGANSQLGDGLTDHWKSATFCHVFSPSEPGRCVADRADRGLWLTSSKDSPPWRHWR